MNPRGIIFNIERGQKVLFYLILFMNPSNDCSQNRTSTRAQTGYWIQNRIKQNFETVQLGKTLDFWFLPNSPWVRFKGDGLREGAVRRFIP